MRIIFLLLICFLALNSNAQKKDTLYYFKRAEQGITLPQKADWFNNQKRFSVFDIPDRLILVHLWNPFDVNCQASIIEANRLQEEYKFTVFVTVLDQHVAQVLTERDIQALCQQYKINHPVIKSADLKGLKLRENQELPLVKGIRSDAELYGEFVGEEGFEELEIRLADLNKEKLLALGMQTNEYNATAAQLHVQKAMNYPQEIVVSAKNNEMYISDSGNNRVLIMSTDGVVLDVVGSGVKGDRDGKWGASQLNHPTGLELDESKDLLYVSDTWNHKVKVIDLKNRTIRTVLGNGTRAYRPESRVDSTRGPICFPSGLLLNKGKLIIAMTGHNQLWSLDVNVKSALPLNFDETNTQLDQPTDVTANELGELFILDHSKSTLKKLANNTLSDVNLFPNDSTGIAGGYGGIAFQKNVMFLSQPFKNRILKVENDEVKVLAGSEPGSVDAKKGKDVQFFHPYGIAYDDKELLVVDQANQRIRKCSVKKGKTSTLEFKGYDKLFEGAEAFNEGDKFFLETVSIGKGMNSVYIQFDLGDDYVWYTGGRNEVQMERAGMNTLISGSPSRGFIETDVPGSEMNLYLSVQLYCTVQDVKTKEVLFRPIILVVPFEYDPSAKRNHDVKWNPFGDL